MRKIFFSRKKLFKSIFTVFLFLIIFNPPLFKNFSFSAFFIIISGIICLYNMRKITVANKISKTLLFLALLLFAYYFFICVINTLVYQNKASIIFTNYLNFIVYNISLIVVACSIIIVFRSQGLNFCELCQSYVNAGLMQALIGIISFLIPAVKIILNNLMIINTNSQKIANTVRFATYRNYGFASQLYDNFGFAMSILAILALWLFLNGRRWNIVPFFLIGFSATLNARTSIILIPIGMIFLLVVDRKNISIFRLLKNITAISIIFMLLILILKNAILSTDSLNAFWIIRGLNEISSFLIERDAQGYFYELIYQMIFFPADFSAILLGTGMLPSQAILKNSDVGYIQNIWQFGLFGSIIYYIIYIYIFYKMAQVSCIPLKNLAASIGVMLFLYLVKLNIIGYGQASIIFTPIIMFALTNEYSKHNILSRN